MVINFNLECQVLEYWEKDFLATLFEDGILYGIAPQHHSL